MCVCVCSVCVCVCVCVLSHNAYIQLNHLSLTGAGKSWIIYLRTSIRRTVLYCVICLVLPLPCLALSCIVSYPILSYPIVWTLIQSNWYENIQLRKTLSSAFYKSISIVLVVNGKSMNQAKDKNDSSNNNKNINNNKRSCSTWAEGNRKSTQMIHFMSPDATPCHDRRLKSIILHFTAIGTVNIYIFFSHKIQSIWKIWINPVSKKTKRPSMHFADRRINVLLYI